MQENLQALVDFKPCVFCVETSSKSLELSDFVWRTRDTTRPLAEFCEEESHLTETLALAGKHILGSHVAPIIPIDIEPAVTRRRLAMSAIFHPIESLLLISRYHGKSESLSSIEEVGAWRSRFKKACPHAFEILFTDRERYMCERIEEISNEYDRTVVLMGLSHVDAVYHQLIDRVDKNS